MAKSILDLRRKSEEQFEASRSILNKENFDSRAKPSEQIAVIVGQLSAVVLNTAADILENLSEFNDLKGLADERHARRLQRIKESSAVRDAAAKGFASGDWSQFDALFSSREDTGDKPEPGPA
jgi:hypothetical protein